jgi:glycosyltransferase involved in cell wall biosynthesis
MWRKRDVRALLTCLRNLTGAYLRERYYGRLSHANVVVSDVDKDALDKISRVPERTHVLLNGVSVPKRHARPPKKAGRLIFSGNMNFPPNYQAAIWFIDHVFPLIRKAHQAAHLVVAGANPVPELLQRAGDSIRVTGYVDDMNDEIAVSSLYVAPLITGGGFKNKVIEAFANGTYIAATSMALEFLDAETVCKILVGDTAESLANGIIQFLSHPEQFEERLLDLHSMVLREFTWRKRTGQLLNIVAKACQDSNADLKYLRPLPDC